MEDFLWGPIAGQEPPSLPELGEHLLIATRFNKFMGTVYRPEDIAEMDESEIALLNEGIDAVNRVQRFNEKVEADKLRQERERGGR